MRKLVTVRQISDITPIEGADRIECVKIDGWNVVSEKGVHRKGTQVLFFEIDSFLPKEDSRFESFMKFGERIFNGVAGHRVKTVRLRGVYSQGIILPLSLFPEISQPELDTDYSELLGVVKWEAAQESGHSMGYQGDAKGTRPHFLPKTDQERIQNIYKKLVNDPNVVNSTFVGTLKLDGSSITVYMHPETKEVGLCSRNIELKLEFEKEVQDQGKFFQGAVNSDLFNKVKDIYDRTGQCVAIQGELVGPGIQGNFEKFDTYQVFAFNIYNISEGCYLPYYKFEVACETFDIKCCPEVTESTQVLLKPLEEILRLSEGKSIINKMREGIVWKQVEGTVQFKAISNKYLEKQVD